MRVVNGDQINDFDALIYDDDIYNDVLLGIDILGGGRLGENRHPSVQVNNL